MTDNQSKSSDIFDPTDEEIRQMPSSDPEKDFSFGGIVIIEVVASDDELEAFWHSLLASFDSTGDSEEAPNRSEEHIVL